MIYPKRESINVSVDILLHICCAQCVSSIHEDLRAKNYNITGYFYNPNIHPLLEFRRRLKSLKVYRERVKFSIIYEEEYGLWKFLEEIKNYDSKRCGFCYRLRLRQAAKKAKNLGIPSFTTTLLISPHQRHNEIKDIGKDIERKENIEFKYFDFRPLYDRSKELTDKFNLYKQSYCGCIFSEYERFKNTTKFFYEDT